ncbi:hypothetical protein [Shewanella surugensis]|uniref:Uncharacterized protein n=1 Tax=Shewanella surugensis TaxID=212020 RepID=A0ABT0L812_9GAMM|nr:hypothetical protein [Shewanella surugensis]MCL1123833.1 hypothetical protein [Shewanella surugensis]
MSELKLSVIFFDLQPSSVCRLADSAWVSAIYKGKTQALKIFMQALTYTLTHLDLWGAVNSLYFVNTSG